MNPSSSPFGNPSSPFGVSNSSSSPFGNPSTPFGVSNSSSSPFGTPSTHASSLFGPQPAFASCLYSPFSSSSSSPFGTSSASPNPTTAPSVGFGCRLSSLFGAPSTPSLFGAPSSPVTFQFHKPNPTTAAACAPVGQFPPAKEEPSWGSPVNVAEFDGITISAEKAAILGYLKRKHPSCLSSLRLRSVSHRRSAYDHLVQVIEELKKAAIGGCYSYNLLLDWLDDLEVYGFDMRWLREEVVKRRDRTMEATAEKEAKLKARDELVKQIEAIDADLAAKDNAAAAAPPEFFYDLFRA